MNELPTAVFLDRDGTISIDTAYVSNPEQVQLIEGAADAIARIKSLLIPVIVITNQSGIGRGFFTEEDHAAVTRRLDELLAQNGAHIDAEYHCPHGPDAGCECRKPGLLLYRQAASDHAGIELSRALFIGDRMRDVEPALALGGNGVMVPSPATPQEEIEWAHSRARVAPSLSTALDWYLCTN
jgi:histidinol-phosphate phosphatase family protein